MCNVYDTTYTFPAQGRYIISSNVENRNANTINLPGITSDISFYIETTIVVNGSLGLNNTPILLNVPVDTAGVGKKFIHNPGAFDADGDSLAYRLSIPKKTTNNNFLLNQFISGYKDPATLGESLINEAGTGVSSLTIDPITGDLIWDAPGKWSVEQYQVNVAFIVEEWRKGTNGQYAKIGEITRDMQIIVVETENNRPILTVPTQICVEAGQKIEFKVKATDKDNNNVKITTNSGVYNLDVNGAATSFINPDPAIFTPRNTVQKTPAEGIFTWQTNCKHVRDQLYDVLFKVEDYPGRFAVQMTDLKTVKIKIIPPRPRGLVAKNTEKGVQLSWALYPECNAKSAELVIYRKEGCSNYVPAQCQLGLPASLGFVEIARVTPTDTIYLDTKSETGKIYSYSIVANLATSDFVTVPSVPSNEACIGSEVPARAPLITNVSVENTENTTGKINLKWTRPVNLDTTAYKGPYQYKIYRATGINAGFFELINSIPTKLNTTKADTLYTDDGLNTVSNGYSYKILFFYEGTKQLSESQVASSVRLTTVAEAQKVRLTWQANVPWSNLNRTHRIYREIKGKPNTYQIIADVPVQAANTFTYTDDGVDRYAEDGTNTIELKVDSTYCYKVETVGAYNRFPQFGILRNFSQKMCGSPIDNTPPCPPTLSSVDIDCKTLDRAKLCEGETISNTFSWKTPLSVNGVLCKGNIIKYSIYFARYQDEKPKLIASLTPTETTFTHTKPIQDGFAGCYYITATNRLNLESVASNIICKDNCPIVELPNVLTPNNDGKNDTFSPMTCMAFVKLITIEIYNRYGVKVFSSSGESLNWDGKSTAGAELPSGTYYYVAQITTQRLNKADEVPTPVKGWIELIR